MKERKWKEDERKGKKEGNLAISLCNDAGGLFGTKMSGTLWVVGILLCGIGKVVERRKTLTTAQRRKGKCAEEVINMVVSGVGRWWIR